MENRPPGGEAPRLPPGKRPIPTIPWEKFKKKTRLEDEYVNPHDRRDAQKVEERRRKVSRMAQALDQQEAQDLLFRVEGADEAERAKNEQFMERYRGIIEKNCVVYERFERQAMMFDFEDFLVRQAARAAEGGGAGSSVAAAPRGPDIDDLHYFSEEQHGTGRRTFLLASLDEFWKQYKATPPLQRHSYELLRESSPCHLYLDLECQTRCNPLYEGGGGKGVVDRLVRLLLAEVQRRYGLAPDPREAVLELDSSTSEKFSRHIIIRLPGAAFLTNAHVGHFIRSVVDREIESYYRDMEERVAGEKGGEAGTSGGEERGAGEEVASPLVEGGSFGAVGVKVRYDGVEGSEVGSWGEGNRGPEEGPISPSQATVVASTAPPPPHWLQVYKDDSRSSLTPLVDLGVYSRNRMFRLVLSSKAKKQAVLQPTCRWSGRRYFDGRLTLVSDSRECLEQSLICAVPEDALRLTSFDASVEGPRGPRCGVGGEGGGGDKGPRPWGVGGQGARANDGPSPFPDIDRFICHVASLDAPLSDIAVRTWTLLDPPGALVLNMRGTRWCGNKGGHHKSNGVFYVVDLKAGSYVQRCHDPECRGYRSSIMPLPLELVPPPPTSPPTAATPAAQPGPAPEPGQGRGPVAWPPLASAPLYPAGPGPYSGSGSLAAPMWGHQDRPQLPPVYAYGSNDRDGARGPGPLEAFGPGPGEDGLDEMDEDEILRRAAREADRMLAEAMAARAARAARGE